MENIQDKISQIMSDPEAMKEIQSLGKMLGMNTEETPKPAPPPSQNDLMSPEALGKLSALMPIINNAGRDDDATRLLAALRPFLGAEKRRKLESAKKMLTVMKLLPLLKSGGLFDLF